MLQLIYSRSTLQKNSLLKHKGVPISKQIIGTPL